MRCAGSPVHEFPLAGGAPVLLPQGEDRAVALAGIAEAASRWAAARGDRWEAARRKVWKTVMATSLEVAPPPGMFADLGAGGAGLASLAAHARYQAVAIDAGMPPEGPYLRAAASFDALPLRDGALRVAAFVASLHYATDVTTALREVRRVVGEDGLLVVALTPVHASEEGAADASATTAGGIRDAVGENALSPVYRHLVREQLHDSLVLAGFAVEERPSGLGSIFQATRRLKAAVTRSEFADFPLLLCRPR